MSLADVACRRLWDFHVALGSLLPKQTTEHLIAARKELLAAARAVIDAGLEICDRLEREIRAEL